MKTARELAETLKQIQNHAKHERTNWRLVDKLCREALAEHEPNWDPRKAEKVVANAHSMLNMSLGMAEQVRDILGQHLRAVEVGPCCEDCSRPYSDEGFSDLVIPNEVFAQISTTGDENGLICPSCLIARLGRAGISTELVALAGPVHCRPCDMRAAAVEAIKVLGRLAATGDLDTEQHRADMLAIGSNLELALATLGQVEEPDPERFNLAVTAAVEAFVRRLIAIKGAPAYPAENALNVRITFKDGAEVRQVAWVTEAGRTLSA